MGSKSAIVSGRITNRAGVVAGNPQTDFVRQAREAFLKRACVRSTFTAADEKLALNLCQRGVSLEQLRWAIWLGCARKYMAMLNGQTRVPITSLAYFATLIDEVSQPDTSASYWEYVRGKVIGDQQVGPWHLADSHHRVELIILNRSLRKGDWIARGSAVAATPHRTALRNTSSRCGVSNPEGVGRSDCGRSLWRQARSPSITCNSSPNPSSATQLSYIKCWSMAAPVSRHWVEVIPFKTSVKTNWRWRTWTSWLGSGIPKPPHG